MYERERSPNYDVPMFGLFLLVLAGIVLLVVFAGPHHSVPNSVSPGTKPAVERCVEDEVFVTDDEHGGACQPIDTLEGQQRVVAESMASYCEAGHAVVHVRVHGDTTGSCR